MASNLSRHGCSQKQASVAIAVSVDWSMWPSIVVLVSGSVLQLSTQCSGSVLQLSTQCSGSVLQLSTQCPCGPANTPALASNGTWASVFSKGHALIRLETWQGLSFGT